MMYNRKNKPESSRRRGSMYITVLGTSILLTIIGLSALMAARVERRTVSLSNDFGQARLHAKSAIEMGLHYIVTNPNWRTDYPHGEWEKDRKVGSGTYTLEGTDDAGDNNLANDEMDPLVLTGIGFEGNARYKLQVRLEAQVRGLSCLEVSLHAGSDINITASTINGNQTISANNSINESSSTINVDAEAVNTITGVGYNGLTTYPVPPRAMPDPNTVFDYYITNGTPIDPSLLPRAAGDVILRKIVLSPANNPYGPTNLEGIYVIDLMGQLLKIQDCRIVGTLVLLNGAPDSILYNQNNWEPAVPNYPALMVRGDFVFRIEWSQLLDEWNANVNFNPPGTPYNGETDELLDDVYPLIMKGLVYVSGNASTLTLEIADFRTFDGSMIVGGTLTAGASLDLTYQPTFLDNPPPGFAAPIRMVITPGTWARVVD